MNQLASLGLILLLALVAGHIVKLFHIPEVTGYILAGVLIGPSVLSVLSGENLAALGILSEVALGLILFSIGSIFEFKKFGAMSRRVILITCVDVAVTFAVMFVGMRVAGISWQSSALLASICVETAAASTLMVIRELNADGPLTDTLTAAIAVNNVLCLTVFTLVLGFVRYSATAGTPGTTVAAALYEALYRIVWQIAGSIALGYLIGLLLGLWGSRVHEHGEMLILLTGSILLTVGIALVMQLSTLVASLAVGATAANYSADSRRVFSVQSRTDPPFYAIFFVIAGANLHLSMIKSLGVVGILYILLRGASKLLSVRLAASRTDLVQEAQPILGFAMLAHAGLAIGLVLTLTRRAPSLAPEVTTIVLAAVLIYELLGPLTTKFALTRAGEAHPDLEVPTADLL